MGAAGEHFAAWWLTQRGMTVLDRNLELEGGEIDLVAIDGSHKVVVEVRSTRGDSGDPIDAIPDAKRKHVTRLASRVGATRVDHLGIRFGAHAVIVHWLPG